MNENGVKFCANCGTTLGDAAPASGPVPNQLPQQTSYAPQPLPMGGGGNSLVKNIGIGCLLAIVIFFFLGLSCTRACFGLRHRRSYLVRHY